MTIIWKRNMPSYSPWRAQPIYMDGTVLWKKFFIDYEWLLRDMLLKNDVQWDKGKTMQQQPKMFENDRKRFTVKFCIELCVSSANLKMVWFVFLYVPALSKAIGSRDIVLEFKSRRMSLSSEPKQDDEEIESEKVCMSYKRMQDFLCLCIFE